LTRDLIRRRSRNGIQSSQDGGTPRRSSASADARAADLDPVIEDIRTAGAKSLSEIARELNAREISAPRGGQWSAAQVRLLFKRLRHQPLGQPHRRRVSNWVLHDYYSVRGSVFDRTLQTSPAKAAAGDTLHHRGRERARSLGPDLQGLPARRRPGSPITVASRNATAQFHVSGQPLISPTRKSRKSFGRNGSSTPVTRVRRVSAAVVAAVTRDQGNCSPTCDAFRRICRSDASSTALSGFGQ
jgi:Recombinase